MNIVVAVPVDENLASFIGKKGSSESITFFNRKVGSDVIVMLFPSQEDEKVHALAESLLISSKIVLSTSAIDRKFGEALVAASLLDKEVLLTDDNNVDALLKGTGMSKYRVLSKEELLDAIAAHAPDTNGGGAGVRVDIDKAFPVRGIGTVALGIVTRGTVRQHDKLYHTSGKQVMVRSLQSQDEDVTSADVGTRVGVSLKDIDESEIGKGDLLTSAPVRRAKNVTLKYRASAAAKETVMEGSSYRFVTNFSRSDCVVTKAGGGEMEVELSNPLPMEQGDGVFLIRKELPRLFAFGTVRAATA
jgi:selenocysteine-specific translation elongation factor